MTREPDHNAARESATDQALAWFARLRAPAAGPADRAAFEAWRAADAAHGAAYAEVEALWASPEFAAAVVRNAPPVRRPRRVFVRALAACAAALVMAVGLGAAFDLTTRLRADAITAVGERRAVTLPDGSTVLLNSDSAVTWHEDAAHRGVRLLAGEAFFDVVHDEARPFVVQAGEARVRVVGTAFSVRQGENGVYVTVLRGAVRVSAAGAAAAPLQLGPGGTALVAGGKAESRGEADVDALLAWRDGRFIFRECTFGAVIDSLSRYHKGWVVVANGALANLPVSGNYSLDDPQAIVDSLAKAVGAQATHVTSRLTILR